MGVYNSRKKSKGLVFLFFFWPLILNTLSIREASGESVYIDPDWRGPHSGTCAEPYGSWTDIVFSADNDYYQKCGTTVEVHASLVFESITGSSDNIVVIGAYYKEGETCQPGLFGERPIVGRSDISGSTFHPKLSSYIQFENLDLRGGESTLFISNSCENTVVRNCRIGFNSSLYGLRVHDSHYGEAYNNLLESNSLSSGHATSDGIIINSSDSWSVHNNKLSGWKHTAIAVAGG